MQELSSIIRRILPPVYIPKKNYKTVSILHTIIALAAINQKKWVIVRHTKIRELLAKYYDIEISPRALCYHLRTLENSGYIQRTKRHIRDHGKFYARPSLYKLQKRAIKYIGQIARFSRKAAALIRDKLLHQVTKKKIRKIFKKHPDTREGNLVAFREAKECLHRPSEDETKSILEMLGKVKECLI